MPVLVLQKMLKELIVVSCSEEAALHRGGLKCAR